MRLIGTSSIIQQIENLEDHCPLDAWFHGFHTSNYLWQSNDRQGDPFQL